MENKCTCSNCLKRHIMKLLRKVEENFKTDSTPFLFWKNNNNLFVYIASLYYNVFLTYDDQNVLNLNNLKISYKQTSHLFDELNKHPKSLHLSIYFLFFRVILFNNNLININHIDAIHNLYRFSLYNNTKVDTNPLNILAHCATKKTISVNSNAFIKPPNKLSHLFTKMNKVQIKFDRSIFTKQLNLKS